MGVKKVNKEIRKQRVLFFCTVIFAVVTIVAIALIVFLNSQSYITVDFESKVELAENVEDVTAKNADVILLNNCILGGVSGSEWVSANKIYENIDKKTPIEIAMYAPNGYLGKFETSVFKKSNGIYYTKTTKYPEPDEYIAVSTQSGLAGYTELSTITTTQKDVSDVKKALGKYRLLNNTVKIVEAYQTTFANGEVCKIYSVVSSGDSLFGVYSAIVYVYGSNRKLVKYSYVKDTEFSSSWPVYSIKYVTDLNKDQRCELVLQATTANKIIYTVNEFKDNREFVEVLKVSIDI